MAEDKVYHAEEISDNPLPNQEAFDISTSQTTGNDIYSPQTIKENRIPTKRTAVELIGTALNTISRKILDVFEFTKMGALQIGEYVNGVSGDLKISPNGITARDKSGITTFGIDGTTGDAVFKGTVQAGTLITGEVTVGNNKVIIDGENKRIIVNDGENDRALIGYQAGGF